MSMLFGGGSGGASQQAAQNRQLQKVANDRQLAELRSEDARVQPSRRRPRGRRLFAEEGGKTNLS